MASSQKDKLPYDPNMTTQSVPNISSDDFTTFFQDHFTEEAVSQFELDFFDPARYHDSAGIPASMPGFAEDVEDDLGYYEDGVKRTLTDEQVEIFRHSELKELRRQKEAQDKKGEKNTPLLENGRLEYGYTAHATHSSESSSNKKKKRGGKRQPQEPKPDLRKRTWDVVDKGLDSLDYD